MTKNENAQKCEYCRFWKCYTQNGYEGTCKRYAPRPGYAETNHADGYYPEWPCMDAVDWCGEFEPKAAVRSTQAA